MLASVLHSLDRLAQSDNKKYQHNSTRNLTLVNMLEATICRRAKAVRQSCRPTFYEASLQLETPILELHPFLFFIQLSEVQHRVALKGTYYTSINILITLPLMTLQYA